MLPASAAAHCVVRANVMYDGNQDYLPTVLIRDAGTTPGVVLRYSHDAKYGLGELPNSFNLVNPLTLIGFPTGSDNLVISGRLDVMRDGDVVRSYGAASAMKRIGSIFSEGDTFTEMRRRGLLLVRDNISAQLCADLPALTEKLTGASQAPHPADGS